MQLKQVLRYIANNFTTTLTTDLLSSLIQIYVVPMYIRLVFFKILFEANFTPGGKKMVCTRTSEA